MEPVKLEPKSLQNEGLYRLGMDDPINDPLINLIASSLSSLSHVQPFTVPQFPSSVSTVGLPSMIPGHTIGANWKIEPQTYSGL